MESTLLIPLGMGLIVLGAGMGIGKFTSARQMCSTKLQTKLLEL